VLGSAARITQQHAEMLCKRIPSVEMVRYCNSGTEATLMAIRAARAFTGKDIIVKMDGGYHGSHDAVQVNLQPDALDESGMPIRTRSRGVPASVLADVLVVPFNDSAALERVLAEHNGQAAAIILEPIMGSGGGIDPKPGYLRSVRELADHFGVLMILDEVLTYRLDVGGVQAIFDVKPDLTALGKIIGGGLPVGAFGGRKDIMAVFDPLGPKALAHSGTFNGNNITMAAGLATMEAYGADEVSRINRLGQQLKHGITDAFHASGIKAHASGMGSIVNVHWQTGEMTTSRSAMAAKSAAGEVPRLMHLELMNRGVFCAPRLQFAVSTPMREHEIDRTVQAFGAALAVLKPYIADQAAHLLADQ
jgi:glutamate-1-semialdehyde 2,1-aminomutase